MTDNIAHPDRIVSEGEPGRRNSIWANAKSSLGLGTVPLAGFGGPCHFNTFEAVVLAAVATGYGYLDTAPMYGSGRGEVSLGQVIRTHHLRDKVVLSTKVGRLLRRKSAAGTDEQFFGVTSWHDAFPFEQTYDYTYDGIMRSVEDSLQRFGLDAFDILYIHDIGAANHGRNADKYWRQLTQEGGLHALDSLRSEGVTSCIGVGANETQVITDVAREFTLDCCLVAGRYTLIDHSALQDFLPEMEARGVKVVAAGVFNSGILGTGVKNGTSSFDYGKAPDAIVRRVAAVEEICDAHGVALPEAALQFVTAHPAITTIMLGCNNVEQVEENWQNYNRRAPRALWDDLRSAGLLPDEAPVPMA